MPYVFALRETKSPVEQVANVRQDFDGSSSAFVNPETAESFGRVRYGFSPAVSESSDCMSQQLLFVIYCSSWSQSVCL
jgi:hypothetical protein